MIRAQERDRELIVEILTSSFRDNLSVNYIIQQDTNRELRLKRFMEYSHDYCRLFGDIFINEERTGCALVVKPDTKRSSLTSILLDVKFVVGCLGLSHLKKAMNREAKIKSQHPKGLLYYVWFIGVNPDEQHNGIGSKLLQEVIKQGQSERRIICLETSTLKNIPWYQSFGFTIYNEMDFGYKLFCLRRE